MKHSVAYRFYPWDWHRGAFLPKIIHPLLKREITARLRWAYANIFNRQATSHLSNLFYYQRGFLIRIWSNHIFSINALSQVFFCTRVITSQTSMRFGEYSDMKLTWAISSEKLTRASATSIQAPKVSFFVFPSTKSVSSCREVGLLRTDCKAFGSLSKILILYCEDDKVR